MTIRTELLRFIGAFERDPAIDAWMSEHEGESSPYFCARLSRTRGGSQRQLPTDHDYAVPTREYQHDQSVAITCRGRA
jgi:hypothetical protein